MPTNQPRLKPAAWNHDCTMTSLAGAFGGAPTRSHVRPASHFQTTWFRGWSTSATRRTMLHSKFLHLRHLTGSRAGRRSRPACCAIRSAGAGCSVHQFVEAFNARNLDAMVGQLSEDCTYHNLAYPQPYHGKQDVRVVLQTLLGATPSDWNLVVDDSTPTSSPEQPHSMAISWHMEAQGRALPLLSGLSFYRVDSCGKICYIKESAEQLVKVPTPLVPLLGGAAPLLQMLAGPAPPGQAMPAAGWATQSGSNQSQAGLPGATARFPPSEGSAAQMVAKQASSSHAGDIHSSRSSSLAMGDLGSSQQPPLVGSSRLSRSNQSSSSSDSGAGSSMLDSMCGVWLKDIEASDMASYDRALQLMQLGGLQRTTAMQLLEGIELERSGAKVAIRYLTVVPFFKVTEEFSLGHPTGMSRRDLKPGRQQATASTGDLGEFTVDISWGPPNTGTLREVYALSEPDVLLLTATVSVSAGTEVTRQVYRRAAGGRWTPRYKWPGSFWGGS